MFSPPRLVLAACAIALLLPTSAAADVAPIDTRDRSAVVTAFHEHYRGTDDYAEHVGWTGSFSGCDPGKLSPEFHSDVIERINYYRAMAGVRPDITLSEPMNAAAQSAAFMIAANGKLSHSPPPSWSCYDVAGLPAADGGNLSIGFNIPRYGPAAVDSQMQDRGESNIDVAHRRWLLASMAPKHFGNGSIPMTPSPNHVNELVSASVFWVITDTPRPAPADQAAIAWPPAGFVPEPIVFDRWSLGLPDPKTNFSNASVKMTAADGSPVQLNVIYRATGAGIADPTIVWEPQIDFSDLSRDATFSVEISGITGTPVNKLSYQVTVIDPFIIEPLTLSGSTSPYLNHPNLYQFTPFAGAEGYDFRHSQLRPADWVEGADAPSSPVIDGTNSTLNLLSSSTFRTPPRSFHLNLNDGDPDQHFELGRDLIPSASSKLEFHHRFRYVGTQTELTAEILPEGGSWTPIWSRLGQCGRFCGPQDWDSAWRPVSIPLSDYAGQVVSLRFRYVFHSGYEWWGFNAGDNQQEYGAFIDDITVSASEQLTSVKIQSLPADSSALTFSPDSAGEYLLQVRAIVGGAQFSFGPPLEVNASSQPPVPTVPPAISSIELDAAGAICIRVANFDQAGLGYELQTTSDLRNGPWVKAQFTVTEQPGTNSSNLCVPAQSADSRLYFRIVYPETINPASP